MESQLLTYLIFLPLVGAVVVALAGKGRDDLNRYLGLGTTILTLLVSIPLWMGFNSSTSEMQFVHRVDWVPAAGIAYLVGIDGISILLVMATTLLCVLAVLGSWNSVTTRVREYMAAILLLETGILGLFCSLDLFLFCVFWGATLIPMYLLIGVWGGERRTYAAIKYVLFALSGSLLMLGAIIWLYFEHGLATGNYTFDLMTITEHSFSVDAQYWLFLAFFMGFAIRLPLFPLHTWLPDALVEAPTGGSVILAGVLLKAGAYGILRVCLPLFPSAVDHFTPLVTVLALIGIVYGALVALVQTDLRRLLAYASVSHLGLILLGMFALNDQGIQGSIIQMVNHGISAGALFLIVGMIYERSHTCEIEALGGLAKVVPGLSVVFMLGTLSLMGLPGLNGFVGEFLILLGAYQANALMGVIATSGTVLCAVYMLWMFQRVVWGAAADGQNARLQDLSIRECVVVGPLVVLMVWIGGYSQSFLKSTDASSKHLIQTVQAKQLRDNGQSVVMRDLTVHEAE